MRKKYKKSENPNFSLIRQWRYLFLGFFLLNLILALPMKALATPILGGDIFVATDGEVIAKFLGYDAAHTNDFYLDTPANGLGIIFTNHTTAVGTTMSLGSFSAGTELIFRIFDRNTGYSYFSGDASRNPDGIAHAVVDNEYSPTETYVGFEDLFGGGDRDYNDIMFSFTNVAYARIPEPSTLLLLGSGLVGLGLLARKRKA